VFAIWAGFGFAYPSAPIPIALNAISKVLCFVAAITLFLPLSGTATQENVLHGTPRASSQRTAALAEGPLRDESHSASFNSLKKETKMKLMRLSVRIPLGLTIAVILIGIVAFTKISSQTGALPMTPFILWMIASIILIAITIWSALGFKGINKRS
jgi:hypothetical protein